MNNTSIDTEELREELTDFLWQNAYFMPTMLVNVGEVEKADRAKLFEIANDVGFI